MTRTAVEPGSVGIGRQADEPNPLTPVEHEGLTPVAFRWRYFGESDKAWTVRKNTPRWASDVDVELEPLYDATLIRTQAAELERLRGLATALDKAVVFNAYNVADPLALRLEFETEADRLDAANALDAARALSDTPPEKNGASDE